MKGLIIILLFIPMMTDTPDTVKVDTVRVDSVKLRSYAPVHKKIAEQNIRLDSIIMMLRNDTIKIK